VFSDVFSMFMFADFFKGAGAWISLVLSKPDDWDPSVRAALVRQFKERDLQPLFQMISETPLQNDEVVDGPQQTIECEPRIFFCGRHCRLPTMFNCSTG
jgi:hypothetical protein